MFIDKFIFILLIIFFDFPNSYRFLSADGGVAGASVVLNTRTRWSSRRSESKTSSSSKRNRVAPAGRSPVVKWTSTPTAAARRKTRTWPRPRGTSAGTRTPWPWCSSRSSCSSFSSCSSAGCAPRTSHHLNAPRCPAFTSRPSASTRPPSAGVR